MLKYIRLAILVLFVLLIGVLCRQCSLKNKYLEQYKISANNYKASQFNLDSITTDNRVYQLTIAELNYTRDSISKKLRETQESLNIRDKNLINMAYIKSTVIKSDTIRIMGDTVFKDVHLNIDTVLYDQWYRLNVQLKYPSSVIVTPKFTSEKYIITSYKKETIAPPKKFWLFRLFQKKQKVVSVEVIEKNPYIQSNTNKFIEIIK